MRSCSEILNSGLRRVPSMSEAMRRMGEGFRFRVVGFAREPPASITSLLLHTIVNMRCCYIRPNNAGDSVRVVGDSQKGSKLCAVRHRPISDSLLHFRFLHEEEGKQMNGVDEGAKPPFSHPSFHSALFFPPFFFYSWRRE